MKCQTFNCDHEATHEFYDMHHGFKVTVHCEDHAKFVKGLRQLMNQCCLIKEISTPN